MSETNPLNLNDIATIVNIFDVASSKGAFTGPDIEVIGSVRNRLAAVVDAARKENSEGATEDKKSQTININDIALSVNIIDLASSKGAFAGPDLETIGTIRNKASSMVEAAKKKDETVTEEADTAAND